MCGNSLDTRMKQYESVPKIHLTRRTPVIIRLDGRAFHSFTEGFVRPFDSVLMRAMEDTMMYLCQNIPGCVLGYKQSDEISLVLVDYQKLDTDAWFNYSVEKICSVAASMATLTFNKAFYNRTHEWYEACTHNLIAANELDSSGMSSLYRDVTSEPIIRFNIEDRHRIYKLAQLEGATFDARVFNLPKEEVMNYMVWRQQDARRNSIQMVGQIYFTDKQLHHRSTDDIIKMLHSDHNIKWEEFATECKLGVCCKKKSVVVEPKSTHKLAKATTRDVWTIDKEIPIFQDDTDYVDALVFVGD